MRAIVIAIVLAGLSIALISVVTSFAMPAAAQAQDVVTGPVAVTDGYMVHYNIRVFGIDTPEIVQKCRDANGSCYDCRAEATKALRAFTRRKDVTCRPTGARTYRRLVATCEVDGEDVSEMMLRSGWAVVYRRYLDDVPGKREAYLAAERTAKDAGRGLWQGEFIMPDRWRNGERLSGCE